MSWTQQNLDEIRKAIATGARRVQFSQAGGGRREIEYRDLKEMKSIEQMIARELSTVRRPNRVLSSFDRGLAK